MDAAGRRIRQPPEAHPPLDYGSVVEIKTEEVVQFSIIVQNPEDSDAVASNVRVRFVAPITASPRLSTAVSVDADNLRPNGRFRLADTVALRSIAGEPLRLVNFREVQYQRNQSDSAYDWGPLETADDCALQTQSTDSRFEIVIRPPSTDGTLAPGFVNAFRIFFLADVAAG